MNCIRWLTSVLLLPAWLHAHACELRVRSHPDPLVYARLPDGGLSGPQLETVREALRRAGCRMKLVPLPWARALRELEDGHLDVLPGAHRLPEREVFAHFSKSDWMAENHLFVRRPPSGELGELAPTSLAAFLQSQRLGVQTGVRYGKELD
ncbi:substrate-binding periplasmic protein [Inhella sp.]|uniref:substrate-binding periplasmic protein n=1 Tax=Inhella sp. TaxID=1921806 RepID=UPI0035AEF574